MTKTRKIIQIDDDLCTGCGDCVPDCAEGSLEIIDGKVRLVADKLCDGLGACLGACPTGALEIIEREADEFDEEAVEEYLAQKKKASAQGCPSATLKMHNKATPCQSANIPGSQPAGSALSQWPIQIRLVPASAPFLEDCDLLVAADCTAFSYASFHQDFLQDKILMMGCPKFDDAQMYVDRFSDIFEQRKLKSLTVLIMEVPCCSSMLNIIKAAREKTASSIPVRQVVISTQGDILYDQNW